MVKTAGSIEDQEAAMQARGMRKVTRWVPDTTSPAYMEEYRRQVAALSAKSEASGAEFWAWVEAVQATEGWV